MKVEAAAADVRCRVCGGVSMNLLRTKCGAEGMSPADVRITDSAYGVTGRLERCADCGFVQCTDAGDVLALYAGMEDVGYEESRAPRALQMRRLLCGLKDLRPGLRLLDVGAASGILVEEARKLGLEAVGIEPSLWLSERARERGLPVHTGVLPHPGVSGPFDIVMLVDIIEHVERPVELLKQARAAVAPDGRVVVVTPDRSSAAAQLLGWRWWHYRKAHIGYFDLSTLDRAMKSAGLLRREWSRPAWYFSVSYLLRRVAVYLPVLRGAADRGILSGAIVPLNLGDSILAVYGPA